MQSFPRLGPLALVLAAAFAFGSVPSEAIERSPEIAPDTEPWLRGTTCTVVYYNVCTGWIWLWYEFRDNDRFGVVYDGCPGECVLETSTILIWDNSSTGRGFTGHIQVYAVDENRCPQGPPLASQAFLPRDGWRTVTWGVPVPDPFIVLVEISNPGFTELPSSFITDHPAPGPTGPTACDTCYPTTRENRSYMWTSDGDPHCPGVPFNLNDGLCDAQLMMHVQMACASEVHETSWSRMKTLFR